MVFRCSKTERFVEICIVLQKTSALNADLFTFLK